MLSRDAQVSYTAATGPFPTSPTLTTSVSTLDSGELISLSVSSVARAVLLALSAMMFAISVHFRVTRVPSSVL